MSEKKEEIKKFLLELNDLLQRTPEGFAFIISRTAGLQLKDINAGITAASGSSADLTFALHQSFNHSPQFRSIVEHSVNCKECQRGFSHLNN
ncbi:hypothetical protein [Epilithonimonas hominis]|uniref:hypothetical protein n=1 Tax=Epilithonimonas hominis TaxID=420404 RepID=UPI002897C2D3|nr:hypothetical protein [Epilithonimonas hominis]